MRTLQQLHDDFLIAFDKMEPRQSKKPLAEIIVEARLNYFERDGTPDYQGRSWEFRTWFSELLDDASLTDRTERDRFTSALRYSTGNVLRQQLTAEQLEDAGLEERSPKERGSQSYRQVAKPNSLLKKDKPFTKEESEQAIDMIRNLFEKLSTESIKELRSDLDKQ